MARDGRQDDTIIGVGRGRVYTPQGGKRIRRSLGYTLGLVAGLLFVTLGFFGLDNRAARLHFDDAEAVPAVVVEADYVKPQLNQSSSSINVNLTGAHDIQASIDNVFQAPDGLSAGERVTVLYDAERPGHALFRSQLGWTKLMFPSGFFPIVLVPTVGYGLAIAKMVAG
ncbi:DUF3592 domain-containing protein [Streptomyces sp. NPDC001652]|uniref:DUF3592 domain-containing protein n=1 Tax=Streptomyces sp. NPDC001652 TaxID=3154393 RepID=UPI00332C8D62